MSSTSTRLRRALGAATTTAVLLAATGCGGAGSARTAASLGTRRAQGSLAPHTRAPGCGGAGSAGTAASVGTGRTEVSVAANTGAPFSETKLAVEQVDSIRNALPTAIRDSGELRIGVGALPAGFPPLAFVGTDQKSLTGAEPDLGRLVAGVLGLEPVLANATWENLFVGFDSGRTDVGFSNITDTEKRKEKYDFASYRQDNLGFEVLKASTWNFDGKYENLAGQRVAVSSGTNQEKILLEWKAKLEAAGKTLEVKYFL